MLTAAMLSNTASEYAEVQTILAVPIVGTTRQFGGALSMSNDGSTLAIGCRLANDTVSEVGAVFVYTRPGATWVQQQKVLANTPAQGSNFGASVHLSADGNTLLVGAPDETVLVSNEGAAYVFTRSGSTWTQQAQLQSPVGQSTSQFGVSVALSNDGNTALVGAYLESAGGFTRCGTAYVFVQSAGVWNVQATLSANDKANYDSFGRYVALSADGNTAIIGADTADVAPYTNNGAAYVFTRSGSTWAQQAKLVASNPTSSDQFGQAVSISDNGNTVVVGAPRKTSDTGFAYIFTRSGSSWSEQAILSSPQSSVNTQFGISSSMSGDGLSVLIGSFKSVVAGPNAAYIFKYVGSSWQPYQKFAAVGGSAPWWGRAVQLAPSNPNIAVIAEPAGNEWVKIFY